MREMKGRFGALEARFTGLEERFTAFEQRYSVQEEWMNRMLAILVRMAERQEPASGLNRGVPLEGRSQ
jgi:hypothetical protein